MRRSVFAVSAAAACLTLAGCASSTTYSTDAATALQQSVLRVAQSAGGKDYAGAEQQLTALQQLDDQELSSGKLTRSRHDEIAISIGKVRADLVALEDQAKQEQLQQQLQQQQQQEQQQEQQKQQPQKPQPGGAGGPGGPGGKKSGKGGGG